MSILHLIFFSILHQPIGDHCHFTLQPAGATALSFHRIQVGHLTDTKASHEKELARDRLIM